MHPIDQYVDEKMDQVTSMIVHRGGTLRSRQVEALGRVAFGEIAKLKMDMAERLLKMEAKIQELKDGI